MLRVLIVEDEAIIAISYEATLIEEGYDVIGIAANAASAFSLAQEHRPQMALIDMNLADGLTGNVIAAGLHKLYGLQYFIITGNPELIDPQVLERSTAVLQKPISYLDLKATLNRKAKLRKFPYEISSSSDVAYSGT